MGDSQTTAAQEAPAVQTQEQPQAPPPAAEPAAPEKKEKRDALAMLLDSAVDETVRRDTEKLALEEAQISLNSRIAVAMYDAGLFEDIKAGTPRQGAARAMVKIELGRTMGVTPYEAMTCIYFVYGRPDIAASLIAARLKRFGYSWEIIAHDPNICSILCLKDGKYITKPKTGKDGTIEHEEINGEMRIKREPVVLSWTIEQAKRAKLVKPDSAWDKYPEDVLFGKVIKRFYKRYASEIFNGADLPDPETPEDAIPDIDLSQVVIATEGKKGSAEAANEVLAKKLAAMEEERKVEPVTEPTVENQTASQEPEAPKEPKRKSNSNKALFQ